MENENQEFLNTQFPGKDGSDIHKPTDAQEQEELAYILQIPSPSSTPQSVEGILKEKYFDEMKADGQNESACKQGWIILYGLNSYLQRALPKAMQEYANQLVGDKEREHEYLLSTTVKGYENILSESKSALLQAQKECEELKERLSRYEKEHGKYL